MKFILLIVLSVVSFSSSSNDYLLKQGEVQITLKDIDGFAYTIPKDKRSGFFSSKKRLTDTLINILNMKLIVDYGIENNKIDLQDLKSEIDERLKHIPVELSSDDSMNSIVKYNSWKNYIQLKERYKYFQLKLKQNVDRKPLGELASEIYMLNKGDYTVPESRNIDYLAVIFNEFNKSEQFNKASSILDDIKSGATIDELEKKYKNKSADIEVVKGLNNYKFDNENKRFSEFVFNSPDIGVIDSIFEIGSRYIIAIVNKINLKHDLAFKDVKEKIIDGLVTTKYERDFQFLLSQLSKQDEIEINKELLDSIETRYY